MGRHSMDNLLPTSASALEPSKLALLGIGAFQLQTILSPNMAIAGISPNFFMVALAVVLAKSSQKTATVAGFVAGIVFDLLGSGPVGCMSLSMAVAAYLISALSDMFKADDIVSWLVLLGISTLAVNLLYCVVVSIAGFETSFFGALAFKALPWTIYNIVVGAALWPAVRRIAGSSKPNMMKSKIQL